MSPRFLLSCGEPSGDLYAGALARELTALAPGVTLSGLGGPAFASAGGTLIDDYRGLSATGLSEGLAKIPRALVTLRRLVRAATAERPDVLVAIDFPDFNFPLARRLKRLGVRVVYYISPQIWAWRPGRLKTMREIADRVLVIFPFEERFYRDASIPVEFVGHPLVDLVAGTTPRELFLPRIGLDPNAPTLALLPGSRPNEVSQILQDLLAAAALVRARIPALQVIVARAPRLDDEWFRGIARDTTASVRVVEGETDAVLRASDVALTASGTATVQAALHDTPMVIVYRVSGLTYLGRRLVKVDTFGMVNLIAGERIVPELIQDDFTPEAAAAEAISMLTDTARASRIREGLARVRERIGGPGASRRAAEAILRVVQAPQTKGGRA